MNINAARETIFNNIRRRLGKTSDSPEHIYNESVSLLDSPDRYRPSLDETRNLERFISKAESERVTATTTSVGSIEHVPQEVRLYLQEKSITPVIALQPRSLLCELDWQGIETHAETAADEPLAVSIADLAIAETGSVVFLSGEDAPTLLNFLPLHHIVVVQQSLIYTHLEDVFTHIGSEQEQQPRNINIVTGTSGTADIEARNVRGAHGPRFMHIIIINDI